MGFKLLWVILVLDVIVVGCNKQRNASLAPIRNNIAFCEKFILDENVEASAKDRYDLFKCVFDQIATIPDVGDKAMLAKELSLLVKKIDLGLSGGDFIRFAERVSRFKSLLDWSVWGLMDANVDPEYTFQILMEGMEKYRKACFSIPITARSASESAEAYAKKCEAIISLASDYEYAILALGKSEKGHLQSFPRNLHDRYKRWKESVSKCPKLEDVRCRLRAFR